MVEVRGIPDLSALPSLCMNYQSTFTYSPPADATGLWSFDASLIPNPVCFMYLNTKTSLGSVTGTLLNAQLDGANHTAKYISFKQLAQRWRLCYMAVTVIQDGPDLANQGTIVVSQPPVQPRKRSICFFGNGNLGTELQCAATTVEFTAEDMPSFDRSQAMPNAYFNKSKEGAYVPLKLTETCQDWISETDDVSVGQFQPQSKGSFSQGILSLPSGLSVALYPYVDLQNVNITGAPTTYLTGQQTSCQMNGNFAHISARNLAVTTSYSFFIRCGVEMQVSPSSTLSPQLKLSPPYDPMALTTYFRICRELKDAYPADYNVTGKLWKVIKEALNALDPIISVMPGSKFVKPAIAAGQQVGDIVVNKRKKNRRKKKAKKAARREKRALVPRRPAPPLPPRAPK